MVVLERRLDDLFGEVHAVKLDLDRTGRVEGGAAAAGAREEDVVLLRRLLDDESLTFCSRRGEKSVSANCNVRGKRRIARTHEHTRPRRDGRSCSCPSEASRVRAPTFEKKEWRP